VTLGCSSTDCGTDTCDSNAAAICSNDAEFCLENNATRSLCNCLTPYVNCLISAGCWTPLIETELESTCVHSGCTVSQCSPNGTVPFLCNSTASAVCETQYEGCTGSSCSCRIMNNQCNFNAGCLASSDIDSCDLNCSTSSCNFLSDTCDANETVTCVNNLINCYSGSTQTQASTCGCMVTFTDCMSSNAGCSGSIMTSLVNGCISFGCDSNSCNSAGSSATSGATGGASGTTGGATGTGATGGASGATGGATGSGGATGGQEGDSTLLLPSFAILSLVLASIF